MSVRTPMTYFTVVAIVLMAFSLVSSPCHAQNVLFAENFDELELGPVFNEQEPFAGDFEFDQVWTDVPPDGWTRRVADDMPGIDDDFVGVLEFEGWTFVNAEWWTQTAGDQSRSQFVNAEETVAVADPDEWDDIGGPSNVGKFNAWLATPQISLAGVEANSAQITFDSSWRPEAFDDGDGTNNQTASLTVAYDGGNPIEVLYWESDAGSPDYKPDSQNETVTLPLNNPAGATSMVIEFGLTNSGNDWWWAVDNIEITGTGGGGGVIGRLQPGDANQDFNFNQVDLVQVQIAAKYLTGSPATWGEGDWDGGPGGTPGAPPPGNGFFDQIDIIAALNANVYLTGPYAAVNQGGTGGDEQTSIIYNPATGELAVDAPASTELTSINIDSAGGIFTGEAALNLGGSFDNDADNNIFKATFGSSFGSLTFGNVAQPGLSEEFVANDLTVIGSLAGGGDLGNVDLIYVPEPSGFLLILAGLCGLVVRARQH